MRTSGAIVSVPKAQPRYAALPQPLEDTVAPLPPWWHLVLIDVVHSIHLLRQKHDHAASLFNHLTNFGITGTFLEQVQGTGTYEITWYDMLPASAEFKCTLYLHNELFLMFPCVPVDECDAVAHNGLILENVPEAMTYVEQSSAFHSIFNVPSQERATLATPVGGPLAHLPPFI